MKKKVCQLVLALGLLSALVVGQPYSLANGPYDETESVVFEGDKAYFKFLDSDVTNTIINDRWSGKIHFTEDEKVMMNAYTYNQATPINTSIDQVKGNIQQLSPELQQAIRLLDQATHKLVIPWNIIIYRYVYADFLLDLGLTREDLTKYYKNKQFDPEVLNKIKAGTSYLKYSFMSTTAMQNAAMPHRPVELRIRVSQGAKAAYVAPYSFYPYELELLLPRQSKLEVIGATLSADRKWLNIETSLKGSLD
ncbi:ADP-ribosyltransferase [Streptococcus halichoeri]|uniref:ADP-ribosyltransferase n=1 Tax=Streptococcus halichoeri TaxID=254785 RepID=UPI00135C2589|nr:ADP-ribosyltransferase [Streptococcus halichoeri]